MSKVLDFEFRSRFKSKTWPTVEIFIEEHALREDLEELEAKFKEYAGDDLHSVFLEVVEHEGKDVLMASAVIKDFGYTLRQMIPMERQLKTWCEENFALIIPGIDGERQLYHDEKPNGGKSVRITIDKDGDSRIEE